VFSTLKKSWRELASGSPGERFQSRYHHKMRSGRKGSRVPLLGAGIALILAGIVLLVVPGPGSLLILVGAAFLAEESLVVSRLLDRIEVQLRKLIAAATSGWRRAFGR
jgi:hypothetical protein